MLESIITRFRSLSLTGIMFKPGSVFLLTLLVTMFPAPDKCQILAANREAQSPVRTAVQLRAILKGHSKSIKTIAFSPNGETIATGSEDGTVRLWSARTGEPRATIVGADKYFRLELKWSPDGQKLAICGARPHEEPLETQVWDTRKEASQPTLIKRFKAYFVEWSPDGRTLLTRGEGAGAMLWDAASGNLKVTLNPKSPSDITANAYFVAGGQRVLTTSNTQPLKLWDTSTGQLITTLPPNEENPTKYHHPVAPAPFFSPDRQLLVSSNVRLFDGANGQLISSLKDVGHPLAFSPDGNMVLTVKHDPEETIFHRQSYLTLWDVAKGSGLMNFRVPEGIRDVYWSPDGKTIVILGFHFNTRLLDTFTGHEKARLPYGTCHPGRWIGSDGCEPFTFSLDGQLLMKLKEPIKLWSVNSGGLIAVVESARLPAVFSPTDKGIFVTKGKDKKTALLWSVESP